jgi:hypothetical protein
MVTSHYFAKQRLSGQNMFFNGVKGRVMASVIVHYSKRHKGFLIRLIQSKDKFCINVFTGKGALHSYSFTSLATAYTFLNAFIKSLKKS